MEKTEKTNKKMKMPETQTKKEMGRESAECEDRCPYHGTLSIRGRRFEGEITKIVGRRAVIEMERIIYYPKFERFSRLKSRLHAHIPKCLAADIKLGDYVEIGECRPLSKIIHFALVKKIRSKEEK